MKPYLVSGVSNCTDIDSVQNSLLPRFLRGKPDTGTHVAKWCFRSCRKDSSFASRAVQIDSTEETKSHIEASPLFSLQPGMDLSNSDKTFETSIGAIINGDIGKKLSLSVSFIAGNSGFADHIDSVIQNYDVVPGQGYAHDTKSGYAYSIYSGYLSYSPSKYFNFQLGQGKNFWGDGYRSLLLSDNSYNYPFFKISTNVWKLKYVNLFTAFRDIRNSAPYSHIPLQAGEGWGDLKYGTFHYLSWNITKRLNIGLFESIIWQGEDSSGERGYDINYLNPIIFYRPVEYSLGSSDNALLGLNLKIKIAKKQQIYGQVIFDEFFLKEIRADFKKMLNPEDTTIISGWWANKYGFQLGFKSFDLFKIKNLSFQTEFNYVRPYTYSHGISLQNYSHFSQPLAHPLGANFYESVSFLKYCYKNWLFEGKFLYAVYGADTSGSNWGGNIFLDYKTPREQDFNNTVAQGAKTDIIYADLRISYLIDPGLNLRVEAGISNRIQNSLQKKGMTNFIYLGLRTALWNVYYDM
ncbi:MAG: hypothetical protein ABII90_13875 [Bacteroidota bacterium]